MNSRRYKLNPEMLEARRALAALYGFTVVGDYKHFRLEWHGKKHITRRSNAIWRDTYHWEYVVGLSLRAWRAGVRRLKKKVDDLEYTGG